MGHAAAWESKMPPCSGLWHSSVGLSVTPGGAVEICCLLGKEESLKRLRTGIAKLEA